MLVIGIIGAENSHTAAIAKTINVNKSVKGFRVDYVWGETADYAKAAAEAGQIPNIVKKPTDMLGKIDALIVDHRHPKYHLDAARPYVAEGIPTFVDKPFCFESKKGKAFIRLSQKKRTPITSFSAVPEQQSFLRFCGKVNKLGRVFTGQTWGPADLKSKWGGIFFYGIHQVDMALKCFGIDVEKVLVTKNGDVATGQLLYSDGRIVTMNLIKQGYSGFAIGAAGEKGEICEKLKMDSNTYLAGVKKICKMFKTGQEPYTVEEMLKPVQVLEALQKSVKFGKVERVSK